MMEVVQPLAAQIDRHHFYASMSLTSDVRAKVLPS